jgi:hypothetical protein
LASDAAGLWNVIWPVLITPDGKSNVYYQACASLRGTHKSNKENIHNVMLTITSLLSILFMTFHLTDDIIRGMASGKVSNLFGC